MSLAADMGAHILPPVPSFYHQPKTIQDIIDQTIGKIFDYFGIQHSLFRRWTGAEPDKETAAGTTDRRAKLRKTGTV
jgi:4-hydroxy-3-polyprenylbenzoate decarboxylase